MKLSSFSRCAALTLLLGALVDTCLAGGAAFDLAGPVLEATVSRAGTTLPASQVPNLAAGDRIWIRANFPASQSAHYLLVTAFLSGSTNPPPESWFAGCKTWTPKCAQDGLTVTVPADAQQMVVFLAPETGGDYKTLVNAVRGRPGAFVRTSQDLNQAELDRSRLEPLSRIHSRAERCRSGQASRKRRRSSRAASPSRWTRSAWIAFPRCKRPV